MSSKLVFIFGVARGGTNLIARSLAEHPSVVVALDILMPVLKAWRNLIYARGLPKDVYARVDATCPFQDFYFDPDGPVLLRTLLGADADLSVSEALLVELRLALVDRARLEHPLLAEGLLNVTGATIGEIMKNLVSSIARWGHVEEKNLPQFVGFKEVWTADFIPALARLFPVAKFIVIHRDPRAVITSLLAMAKLDLTQKGHPISYLRHWRKLVFLAQQFADEPSLGSRVFQVRFEDLCLSPVIELERLCTFLGISLADTMLGTGNNWEGNSSFGLTSKLFDTAAVHRWRSFIEPSMLRTVEFHCGHEMRLMGYATEADSTSLTTDIIETVRQYDHDPGKWRSDYGNWRDGLAWECLRQSLLKIEAPEDFSALFLLQFAFVASK